MQPKGGNRDASRQNETFLQQTAFLSFLGPAGRKTALDRMSQKSFRAGDVIVKADTPPDRVGGLHVIIQGTALVRTRGASDARLEPGQILGERSIVRNEPTMSTVTAGTPVTTAFLPKDTFLNLYRRSGRFHEYIDGIIRLREQWEQLILLVSSNKLLRLLGQDETKRLLESGHIKEVDAGKKVLKAGDPGTKVLMVVRGSLAVQLPASAKVEATRLAVKKMGDLVGESAMVLERSQPTDVVTIEKSDLLVLERDAFMKAVNRNPWVLNQLQKELLAGVVGADASLDRAVGSFLTFVLGTEPGLGATTIAYGLAGALRRPANFNDNTDAILVDLDGDDSAGTLGLNTVTGTLHGVGTRSIPRSDDWDLEVVWPVKTGDTGRLLAALEKTGRPVIVTGRPDRQASLKALDMAGAVVFVRKAGAGLHQMMVRQHQLGVQAVRVVPGLAQPLEHSRKAVRVLDDPRSFLGHGLTGCPGDSQRVPGQVMLQTFARPARFQRRRGPRGGRCFRIRPPGPAEGSRKSRHTHRLRVRGFLRFSGGRALRGRGPGGGRVHRTRPRQAHEPGGGRPPRYRRIRELRGRNLQWPHPGTHRDPVLSGRL
ncbi:MAG: cyclic nucleotide-binding domain-containing protein [Deltaproteobacteria bacterium]|nr:cyclic nucleotide-binding domain-containing protein [Deltaproteobacteria bacterium]